ncbi:hypothetical protein DYB37_012397 [Aphanomyces astaci]|uniref:PX domain-containing protein n=1 Tax=Aphanomyces astaci TaxID=112090 RepID=A0A3R7B8Q6_APHAT|nr:hypothetical protein DYB37_012397 [Aphanomyces astaci]
MGCTQSTTSATAEPQQPEATTASGATDQPAAAAVVAAPTSTTTGTVAKTEATVPLTSDATPEVPVVGGQEVTIVGHSIDAKGVVLYHIQTPATDGSDQPVIVKKRFNEFKQFHRQVSASSTDAPVLPALPSAGLFTTFQRTQDTLIKTRSARLQEILQAASRDQVVAFVAEQPKTPEVVVDEAPVVVAEVETTNATAPLDQKPAESAPTDTAPATAEVLQPAASAVAESTAEVAVQPAAVAEVPVKTDAVPKSEPVQVVEVATAVASSKQQDAPPANVDVIVPVVRADEKAATAVA